MAPLTFTKCYPNYSEMQFGRVSFNMWESLVNLYIPESDAWLNMSNVTIRAFLTNKDCLYGCNVCAFPLYLFGANTTQVLDIRISFERVTI